MTATLDRASVLLKCANGDLDAHQQSVTDYGALVWWLAKRFTGSVADEATQEVFLNLWRNAAEWDQEQPTELVFVVTIARQTLIDLRRRFALDGDGAGDGDDEGGSAHDGETHTRGLPKLVPDANSCGQMAVVSAVIAGLSESEQVILTHSIHEVESIASVARRLEQAPDAVRSQLAQTLGRVQHAILPENTISPKPTARLEQLLIDEVSQGLSAFDRDELDLLLVRTSCEESTSNTDSVVDQLHTTVAMVQLQLLADAHAAAPSAGPSAGPSRAPSSGPAQLPVLLEADLRQLAKQEAKRTKAGTRQPTESSRILGLGLSPAWWVAVAALFLAFLGWWPRFPFVSTVTAPRDTAVRASPQGQLPDSDRLSQLIDTLTIVMAPTNDVTASAVAKWNQRLARGVLHVDGFSVNDPGAFRYQMMIHDQTDTGVRMVNGGSFDITTQATRIVPIQPQQSISEVVGFTITGGTVNLEGRSSPDIRR